MGLFFRQFFVSVGGALVIIDVTMLWYQGSQVFYPVDSNNWVFFCGRWGSPNDIFENNCLALNLVHVAGVLRKYCIIRQIGKF